MMMSQVQISDVKKYANVFFTDDDSLFTLILTAARSFVSTYTGLPLTSTDPTVDCCDNHEDLTIALFVLCNEMYDNREYSTDKVQVNFVVKQILDSYSVNYL
jgi:hypothetical protein